MRKFVVTFNVGGNDQRGNVSAANISNAIVKARKLVPDVNGLIIDVSEVRGERDYNPSLASLVKASAAVHRGQSELCKAYSDHLMEGIKAARRGESE